MGKNKSKQTKRTEGWAKEGKRVNWEISKSLIVGLFALAASIVALYEAIDYFRSDPQTFYYIIFPILAGVASLGLLFQAFRRKNPVAFVWLAVSMLILTLVLIAWRSYVIAEENKLIVVVATFDGPEEIYGLQNEIIENLNVNFKNDVGIKIIASKETITLTDGSENARKLGENEYADVVIWGWYRPTDNPNVTIHIENLTEYHFLEFLRESEILRPVSSLVELESFSFQQKIGHTTSSLISFLAGFFEYLGGDYKIAIERFDSVLENQAETALIFLEDQPTIYFYRGNSKLLINEFQSAIMDFNQVVRLDPKNTAAYICRGAAYMNIGEYKLALQDYNQALEINPKDINAYNDRGLVYNAMMEYQLAIQDYDKAIEIAPEYIEAYLNRGVSYTSLGKYERAIQDYDSAIKISPRYSDAYNNRGNVYSDLGKYELAIQEFNRAIKYDSKNIRAYFNRGNTNIFLGNYRRAIQDFDQVIQRNPIDAEAYAKRGFAYALLGNRDFFIHDFDKSLDIDSKNETTYYLRGVSFLKLGEYQQSIRDLDSALEINNQYADAYQVRGFAYQALGNTAEAEVDFKKYQELTGLPTPYLPAP